MNAAERFFARPIAIWPGYTAALLELLRTPGAFGNAEKRDNYRAYDVIDGVAVVPICGALCHDESWCGQSYKRIGQTFGAALFDPEVRAIAMHMNSPGGEVAGCFDLAENILASRGVKPIWAIVDEMAYSAAYALACAADKIIVPRTGGVGSIGVVSMHLDVTKALENFGVKVTTFQFGERKTDSYPTTPLSEEANARFQADVDSMGEMFVDLVARARGLDAKSVRDTQAATFLGKIGVDRKLADTVASPEEAFLELVAQVA